MPSQQGVMPWPASGPNVSVLVEETRWPIEAGTVDRLIVVHGLETCDSPDALLREVWRVLAPSGRVIFLVSNRSGLWARRDVTPFGFGRPYTLGQIEGLLRKHRLEPERHAAALYGPPSHRKFWIQTAHFWERLGRRFEPRLIAGALLVEAAKQVYARPSANGAKVMVPGPLRGGRRPRDAQAGARRPPRPRRACE